MSNKPLISVVTPVYNGEKYLQETIESVRAQTYQNWEHIIVNNCSKDQSLSLARQNASEDSRIKVHDNPTFLAMIDNWNNSYRKASGQYVYGLGADDIMPPDYLEKLVTALEEHPECELAHCRLRLIDENGKDRPDWWSKTSVFARSSPGLLEQRHIRRAPFDGLLYLSGESVYVTGTQLLVRRTLFDRIGLYDGRWGGLDDFHWCMRASLVANTIHVPGTWGGWRIHSKQAGADNTRDKRDYNRKITEMIDDAIRVSQPALKEKLPLDRLSQWCRSAADLRSVCWELERLGSTGAARRAFLVRQILRGSKAARGHVTARLRGKSLCLGQELPAVVRAWFEEAGLGPAIVPC